MRPASADHLSLDLKRAEALCDVGRFREAAKLIHSAVSRQPQEPEGWCLLARAELGAGNHEQALSAAETGVALEPDAEWPHRLRSSALLAMDRCVEAVEAARTTVRLQPGGWQAHACLARALAWTGRDGNEAIEAGQCAVELAPLEPEAHLALGQASAAAGRRDLARHAFQRTLALDPQHAVAHNELAGLNLNGRLPEGPRALAEAVTGFATAVRTDPADAVLRYNLDITLRHFLVRIAHLVFIAAFIVGRLGPVPPNEVRVRLIPIALLAIPAVFGARFVLRLDQRLRRHLFEVITGPRLRLLAATELLAVSCLAATALVPTGIRHPLALTAVVLALLGRILHHGEVHRVQRAAGIPVVYMLGNLVLWTLALALLAIAAICFVMAPTPDADIGVAVGIGAACLCGSIFTVYVIIRRRKLASGPDRAVVATHPG